MTAKLYVFLTFAFLQLLLASCAHKETISYQGTIVHETTGEPVENASVQIDLFVDGGLFTRGRIFVKGTYTLFDILQTDELGEFRFEIESGSHVMISLIDQRSGRKKIIGLVDILQANQAGVVLTYPNSFIYPVHSAAE